jgi:uncharacterized membrane protein YphA (DoxX/SURF4 family)
MLGSIRPAEGMSCVMHVSNATELNIGHPEDPADIEHSSAGIQRSSADYYTLIARAIGHLKENTPESRRSLYAHTETRLVAELRGLDPPSTEAEITSERMSFHEAIRKVETEAVRSRVAFLVKKGPDPNHRTVARAPTAYPWEESTAAANYPPASNGFKHPLGLGTVTFAIARIAIVIAFIVSGVFRLMDIDASATAIASKVFPLPGPLAGAAASIEATLGLPFTQALAIAGAALEIVAGVLVALGIFIRSASLLLVIFTALSIYYSQWDLEGGLRSDQMIRALNDLCIIGGLLTLIAPRPHALGAGDDSFGDTPGPDLTSILRKLDSDEQAGQRPSRLA